MQTKNIPSTSDNVVEKTTGKELLVGVMFFFSGLCCLLYQTVWLRLAFAQFGVITPVVSIVVSVFMLGLGLGSWLAGKKAAIWKTRVGGSAITLYAIVELFIASGAIIVPLLLRAGGSAVASIGGGSTSWSYLFLSALAIVVAILPWAVAMGMTYPVALEFFHDIKQRQKRSFGFLYAANTAGAFVGAILTVFFLIEIFGFKRTLLVGAFCNLCIGLAAAYLGQRMPKTSTNPETVANSDLLEEKETLSNNNNIFAWSVLFFTGFCSMAMEVAWIRSFSVQLGSVVYSFAIVLAIYLLGNWLGAFLYRLDVLRNKIRAKNLLLGLTAISSTIPLVASCPMLWLSSFDKVCQSLIARPLDTPILFILLPFSVAMFSACLGYLTPLIIDDFSLGNSEKAGKAYAINIAGCILGPLLVGYLLMPLTGARLSLIMLIVPLAALCAIGFKKEQFAKTSQITMTLISVAILIVCLTSKSWEEGAQLLGHSTKPDIVLRRDYSATTISTDALGYKALLVNGVGVTCVCTIAKLMVHLPMALCQEPPKSSLVICFGMGTTFRSALSWGQKVKAVELLPSVTQAFDYYHDDAQSVLKNPNGQIIVDDGRRFLRRTKEKFDMVTIDPPPPPEAAASSLLYSKEFYRLIKKHLNRNGILQQWYGFPYGEKIILEGVVRSLLDVFPYVRIYQAYDDRAREISGWYMLASDSPIKDMNVEEFMSKLPIKAKKDLLELSSTRPKELEIRTLVNKVLTHPIAPESFLLNNHTAEITDDHPLNEYYWLRRNTGNYVFLGN